MEYMAQQMDNQIESSQRTYAEMSERIRKLEKGLNDLRSYAVCNCPEDEETGRVTYHSNCHRHALAIIEKALS